MVLLIWGNRIDCFGTLKRRGTGFVQKKIVQMPKLSKKFLKVWRENVKISHLFSNVFLVFSHLDHEENNMNRANSLKGSELFEGHTRSFLVVHIMSTLLFFHYSWMGKGFLTTIPLNFGQPYLRAESMMTTQIFKHWDFRAWKLTKTMLIIK